MKRDGKLFVHAGILLVSAVVIAVLLGEITKPKFYNDNYWPLDVTYQGFYEMDRDTVDVLFLGSSHAISAFSPQELYDKTGIRSFNLASEEQSLFVSYYWLKEALRLQSPKAVVIDTVVCFPYMETQYNCTEPSVRKALDPMKWSSVKGEAVNELGKLDQQQTIGSFVFPLIRYHARWNDLTRNDFRFWPSQNTSLKGYAVLSEDAMVEDFQPVEDRETVPAGTDARMMQYMDRIADLCRIEGIELILVNTPYYEATDATHRAIADYAASRNLTYINYNEASVYERLNFDFPHDMADAGHANTSGAIKLTDDIGAVLLEKGIQPVSDAQYEKTREYCARQVRNANLYRIDTLKEYLDSFDAEQYLMFVTASENADTALLGLTEDKPFAAVADNGGWTTVYKPASKYQLKENLNWSMEPGEEYAKIQVYDLVYTRAQKGIQIVLLDKEKGYVIDSSCFDEAGNRVQ